MVWLAQLCGLGRYNFYPPSVRADALLVLSSSMWNWIYSCYMWNLGLQVWPNIWAQRHVKRCWSCQKNKKGSRDYGHLLSKTAIINPWEALCVNLIGLYTLKGKDGLVLNFMFLTMIDPATGWFKMVELPVIEIFKTDGDDVRAFEAFDKTSLL